MHFLKQHKLVSSMLLLLIATIVYVASRPTSIDHPRTPTCATHLKILSIAMLMYAEDYDGPLPNALTWPADLLPYSQRTDRYYHCPEDPRLGERSYDMLQRWSHQPLPQEQADRLIVLYEIGKHGLEYRHDEGMYIGHGDGHVKWYPQSIITPKTILSGTLPAATP